MRLVGSESPLTRNKGEKEEHKQASMHRTQTYNTTQHKLTQNIDVFGKKWGPKHVKGIKERKVICDWEEIKREWHDQKKSSLCVSIGQAWDA